jgi:DNA-binding IclR family transcriptional regulator
MQQQKAAKMNDVEVEIMRYFRRYDVGVGKVLFFATGPAKVHPAQFYHAMASLMRQGLVVKERHRGAYSLTPSGYRASLTA